VPAYVVRRNGLVVAALWRNAPQEKCDFEAFSTPFTAVVGRPAGEPDVGPG